MLCDKERTVRRDLMLVLLLATMAAAAAATDGAACPSSQPTPSTPCPARSRGGDEGEADKSDRLYQFTSIVERIDWNDPTQRRLHFGDGLTADASASIDTSFARAVANLDRPLIFRNLPSLTAAALTEDSPLWTPERMLRQLSDSGSTRLSVKLMRRAVSRDSAAAAGSIDSDAAAASAPAPASAAAPPADRDRDEYDTADGTNELFASSQPMATIPELMRLYESHFRLVSMSATDFFRFAAPGLTTTTPTTTSTEADAGAGAEAERRRWSRRLLKYERSIEEWGPEYSHPVLSAIRPFIPQPNSTGSAIPHSVQPSVYLWMGQAGSVTPCHLDHTYNFYVQLRGQKRFLLFPPGQARRLYMRPSLHPAHRSAALPVEARRSVLCRRSDSDSDSAGSDGSERDGGGGLRFPLACIDPPIAATEAVLEPGDVLFLPPLWFHHVSNERSFTTAVNVWTGYEPSEWAATARSALSLPQHARMEAATKVQAVRGYLFLLLKQLMPLLLPPLTPAPSTADAAESQTRDWIREVLYDGRYRLIPVLDDDGSGGTAIPPSSYCHNSTHLRLHTMSDKSLVASLRGALQTAASVLRNVANTAGRERFEVLLADVVEWTLHDQFGARTIKRVLHDLVFC